MIDVTEGVWLDHRGLHGEVWVAFASHPPFAHG